jgi:hypothetical protein
MVGSVLRGVLSGSDELGGLVLLASAALMCEDYIISMMKWKDKTWCNETLTSFFSGVGVETGGVADAAALEMSNIFRVRAANCVCSAGN